MVDGVGRLMFSYGVCVCGESVNAHSPDSPDHACTTPGSTCRVYRSADSANAALSALARRVVELGAGLDAVRAGGDGRLDEVRTLRRRVESLEAALALHQHAKWKDGEVHDVHDVALYTALTTKGT